MVVTYCSLERENDAVLKFHMNNFSYFGIRGSFFLGALIRGNKV